MTIEGLKALLEKSIPMHVDIGIPADECQGLLDDIMTMELKYANLQQITLAMMR